MSRSARRVSIPVRTGCILGCVVGFVLLFASCQHILDEASHAARIHTCRSNIKQLSQNINLYAQDWDDRLPMASALSDAIWNFEDHLLSFRCPDYPVNAPGLGYAYNSNLSLRRRATVADPGTTPLLYDSDILQSNAHAPGRTGLADPPRHNVPREDVMLGFHLMNAIGFLDGHTASLDTQAGVEAKKRE